MFRINSINSVNNLNSFSWNDFINILALIGSWITIFFLLIERREHNRPYLQITFELVRSSLACIVLTNTGNVPLTIRNLKFDEEFIKQLPETEQKLLRKQKNDIIDSIIIADYLRVFGSKNSKLPEENILSLKQLTRFRSNIVSNVSSLKVQVIGLLDKVFPEYKKLFCDIFGTTSKQLLLNCPTPEDIIKIPTTKLANLLSKHSKGRFNKDTATHIKETAKNSFGIKFTTDACSFEIKQLINQIIFLENQIDEVSKQIKELYDKLDSHLLSVPGIGVNLAPIILAEIGDINNFDKPSKLIAFAGADPSENQSGNKLSTNDKTSKRGSPYLRHAIYTASLVAISNEPELRAYYDKKIKEGKHHFVALTGISRKLLTIIYYILKEDRDYIRYDQKHN